MSELSFNKDVYYTISNPAREEIKIKGSKFIASVCSVNTRKDAQMFLENIKNEFYDATHNCYAYSLGPFGIEEKYSDDGEPNGSAGKPILFTIKKFNFSDVICVVTRYFGGTKLGVGGLSKAYQEAAKAAFEKCNPKPIHLTETVNIFCTYEEISIIKKLISQYAVSFKEVYLDTIDISADVPKSKVDEFLKQIIENTNGKASGVIQRY